MSAGVEVLAQAKVNLALRILARETSGYHTIETLFHRIDLADHVRVRRGGVGLTIDCSSTDCGPVEQNLAFRAARLYLEHTGWSAGLQIEVEKRIPIGAGLGGGSADAAAVLRALDVLAPRPLSTADRLRLASQLGADVPFLASEAVCALGWGRGDRFLSLSALPRRDLWIVVPPFGIATKEAYEAVSARRLPVRSGVALSRDDLGDWVAVASFCENDFASMLMDRHPALRTALASLKAAGTSVAGVTGSGTALFGVMPLAAVGAAESARSGGAGAGPPPPSAMPAIDLPTGFAILRTATSEHVVAPRWMD